VSQLTGNSAEPLKRSNDNSVVNAITIIDTTIKPMCCVTSTDPIKRTLLRRRPTTDNSAPATTSNLGAPATTSAGAAKDRLEKWSTEGWKVRQGASRDGNAPCRLEHKVAVKDLASLLARPTRTVVLSRPTFGWLWSDMREPMATHPGRNQSYRQWDNDEIRIFGWVDGK
jgi:hypothetical protein